MKKSVIHSAAIIPVATLLSLLSACANNFLEVTVVDERTALENQVLGTYEELSQEVLMVASVRYIDPKGKLKEAPEIPPGKKNVIRALQRASFNKDDLDDLKKAGILGEDNQGGISLISKDKVEDGKIAFVEALVQQENSDRETIMSRVIETNENLTADDLARVRKMFASMHRDKARTGDMVQNSNGDWVAHTKAKGQ